MPDSTTAQSILDLGLTPIDPLDYEPPTNKSKHYRPPDPGRHALWLDDEPDSVVSTYDRKGSPYWSVVFRVETGADKAPRIFDFLNLRRYPFRQGTTADDFIRATGYTGPRPESVEGFTDIIMSMTTTTFEAWLDWEAYCSACKLTIRGSDKFPRYDDGTLDHELPCPSCSALLGAKAKVKWYVVPQN